MSIPFTKTFLRGEALTSFWNIANKGVGLVNSFLILNFLSIFQFGLYQLIISFGVIIVSFLSGLFDSVVANDVSRFIADKKKEFAKKLLIEYAWIKVALGIAGTVIIFWTSNPIARIYDKDIGSLIRVIAFMAILEAISSLQVIFFQATVSFSNVPAGTVGESGKFLVLAGFWLWSSVGIREVLIAYIIAQLIAVLYSGFHFVKEFRREFGEVQPVKHSVFWGLVKEFGVILIVKYYLSQISKNIQPWLIKFVINTEAVAIFQLAFTIMSMAFSVFPVRTFGMLIPREVGDSGRSAHVFYRSIKYAIMLGLVYVVLGLIFVPAVVNALLPKYNVAIPLFFVMLATMIIYPPYKVIRTFVIALREQAILVKRTTVMFIMTPVFLFLLLSVFGVMGAAIEFVLSYIVTTGIFYYYLVKKHSHLVLQPRALFSFDAYDRDFLKKLVIQGKEMLLRRLRKKAW